MAYSTFKRHEERGDIPKPRVAIGLPGASIIVHGWLGGDGIAYRDGTLNEDYDTVTYASKVELAPLLGISRPTLQTINHRPAIMVNTRRGWSYEDIITIAADRGWTINDHETARQAGQLGINIGGPHSIESRQRQERSQHVEH